MPGQRNRRARRKGGAGNKSGANKGADKSGSGSKDDMLQKAVGPLLVQLASEEPDVRHLACNSLAHITADPAAHPTLLQMGTTQPLLNALQDYEHLPIQSEAAGCFRNFATTSDDAVLAHVFDSDTQHALATVFAQVTVPTSLGMSSLGMHKQAFTHPNFTHTHTQTHTNTHTHTHTHCRCWLLAARVGD